MAAVATSGSSGVKASLSSLGEGISTRWGNADKYTKGFLNPTAIGAGAGMALGGAYGGFSDNGSVLGGMAGGALLGAGVGAGYMAGSNKLKFSQFTGPAGDYSNIATKKTYTV